MLLLVESKMHKSELQELCQRNVWRLPEYSNSRDGPDHEPCFSSIVVVNGVSFQSSNICRTVKAAQNNAAEIAFNHLSGTSSGSGSGANETSVLPTSQNGLEATLPIQSQTGNVMQPPLNPVGIKDNKNSDGQHWYKNRLQCYAQKRNLGLPVYSYERQGPPHASQFKSRVTFGGQSYEGTNFFFTLKEAENDAAKVAFEQVSPNEEHEDESAFYKILLQELAKKRGFLLPTYETKGIGTPHTPVFVATVKVCDKVYQGPSAKNKKQAEISAAKSAYDSLQDGTLHLNEKHLQNGCTKENLQTGTLQLNEHLRNGCTKENLQIVLPTSQNELEATPLPIQSHTGDVMQPPLTPVGIKDNKNSDGQHWYKNRLQCYAQKRNSGLPIYSYERQGPPHASQFKSRVTVDGQSYEGTNFFFTLKEAENDAAKVAFEQVSPNEEHENESAFYKILLQELAKKRGFLLPTYETKGIGTPHIPVFVATVKVGDKVYQGLSAKNKKQAEMSAAKSAYDSLQDGTLHLNEQHLQNGCTKENLQPGPMHLNEQHQHNVCTKEILQMGSLHLNEQPQQNICTEENLQMEAIECEIQLKNPCVSKEIKEEAILSDPTTKSTESGFSDPSPMHPQTTVTDENNNLPPAGKQAKSDKLVYQKIVVCPRSMVSNFLESGIASDVTYRDDNWVALRMNRNL